MSLLAQAPACHTPFIYKVDGTSGATSYLLGSRHLGTSIDELPPQVRVLHAQASLHVYEWKRSKGSMDRWDDLHLNPERAYANNFEGRNNSTDLPLDIQRKLIHEYGIRPIHVKHLRDQDCDFFVHREEYKKSTNPLIKIS